MIAPNTNGGTPLSNYEMAKIQSFIGFDFSGTWKIYQDETYPFFQWHEKIYIPWKINIGE